ncbi:hypothetical protein [Microbacterium sp. 18062]|uniref:hypothetical protein n=1 Tax=Microbacterium sp. 18062 TaxID=2681410 RepID=UPI001357FFD2|nr:hypothetical protein [Microbacterium sp. 18062]
MTSPRDRLDPDAAFAGRVDGERAPFSLSTVAASAPVLVQLSDDMRRLRASTDHPRLREALSDVLAGRAPLSSLLAAGVLPAPPAQMPEALKTMLEADEERS